MVRVEFKMPQCYNVTAETLTQSERNDDVWKIKQSTYGQTDDTMNRRLKVCHTLI